MGGDVEVLHPQGRPSCWVCLSQQMICPCLAFLAIRLHALMIPGFGQGSNQWQSVSQLEDVVWVEGSI